ncbi:MAG TPA: glycoside hydrolase family 3 N-terminal domain-containing protein [Cytophagaceae bacterium]
MLKKVVGFLLFPILLLVASAWKSPGRNSSKLTQEQWVDSVMSSLSEEQKIGQLFMVAAYSNKDQKHINEIEELVRKYNIGGLIFFQGGPGRQVNLTNHYQSIAKVPLMIGMDAEWGLGMRLDSTLFFPKQMTLGAIQDDSLIFKMGAEIARECRRIGVHINFAPVVDINCNPNNPVIGMRSFGESKELVAAKGIAYMNGMQAYKVLANAKHFPGHGDTETDSHVGLPVINHTKDRLDEIELYPFKKLIEAGVMSMMVGHMHIPALDNTPNIATTLSKNVVTDLLRGDLGYQGLIFTDALNMKGVSSFYKPGEVDLMALLAGNDVLLYSENVPNAIKKIQKAIKDNEISAEEVHSRVRKILRAKYWLGLNEYQPIELKNLHSDLNNSKARSIQTELYQKALTVVNNQESRIPIRILDTTTFASVSIGKGLENEFQRMLSNYAPFTHFAIEDKNAEEAVYTKVLEQLRKYEVVVVGVHNTNLFNSKTYGITENTKRFIARLNEQGITTIVSVFGNPYSLKYFIDSPNLICAYEDNEITNRLVPQLVFGGISASGKLPVSVHANMPVGHGLLTDNTLHRLRYSFPENEGMDGKTLLRIDSIVEKSIADKAMPGCQVLVAKNGAVVFSKNYGYLTYDKQQPVTSSTVYDIASISKVAGTLQAVMFLQERGLIKLDKKISYYLPELKGTNKDDLIIRDVLTHQAGLIPFLPHWKKTVDTSGYMKAYYSTTKDTLYTREVVPGVYCIKSIEDTLWAWTVESDLLKKPKRAKKHDYVYSDLGFYIMKRVVERILNQPLDEFMQQNFYDPLGLATLTYKPLEKYSVDKIAPTEDDKYFRMTLIRGTVHDQGAAMLGGCAGHAGLFSNANDLAVIMQMNLQYGYYGGLRYFLPETIPYFAKKQFEKNRRGLGWDKPEPSGNGPTSNYASPNTFGHTGFTGTAAWVDPDQNLVYIFLSNRVHPDASNNKLIRASVRTVIQDVIYQSILNYKE